MDENGGLGLAGFCFYYFLFKTTTNAFLLFPVFCNNVFCFHFTTTFLFVLSLHRHFHRHHAHFQFFPPPPPPLPHFNCFTTSHYGITQTTQKCREKMKLKKRVGISHHPCDLTLLYSLSFAQIKTESYRAKI